MMDRETVRRMRREVIRDHGPWLNHSISLGDGLYTEPCNPGAKRAGGDDVVLRRVLQTINDLSLTPLNSSRVLDLGALEGLYAIELARQGMQATATDVREDHLAKIRFVKAALGLDNLSVKLDDVRNLGPDNYGYFEFTLCLGLLYHLGGVDVCQVLSRMASVTTRAAIIDTHIAHWADAEFEHGDHKYFGRKFHEHGAQDDEAVQVGRMTASIGNTSSFWFTQKSLYRALLQAGFSSVYEVHVPHAHWKHVDRVTLVALRSEPVHLHSSPGNNSLSAELGLDETLDSPRASNYLPDNVVQVSRPGSTRNVSPVLHIKSCVGRLVRRVGGRVKRAVARGDSDPRPMGVHRWPALQEDYAYRARISFLVGFTHEQARCLDIGCACGLVMEVMSPESGEVVGLEPDAARATEARTQLARKERTNTEVLQGQAGVLISADARLQQSFDVVYSLDFIEYSPVPTDVLKAAGRAVSPGGVVIIGTPEKNGSQPGAAGRWSEQEFVSLLSEYFQIDEVRRLPLLLGTGKVEAEGYMAAICRQRAMHAAGAPAQPGNGGG